VLAVELADRGVRVNAVAPGFTATPMNEKLREDPAVAKFTISVTPLGRLAQVNDIAPAVVFLSSDAARFISGVVLPVAGGYPNAFSAPGSANVNGSTQQTQTELQ
jgi:NAD(P)-dependent dehydrogenase (short-subunit alcohol dehydrogenase family)